MPTLGPLIDGMRSCVVQSRIQILPQNFEFVIHVNEEHISVAARSPGVTTDPSMAVVAIECLLFGPCSVSVCPANRVKCCGILSVPKVDPYHLIGVVAWVLCLSWYWAVIVGGIRVEGPVPTCL